MRRITPGQSLAFGLLMVVAVAVGAALTGAIIDLLPPGDFRGVIGVVLGVVLIYLASIALCRLFLHFYPLREGAIAKGSQAESRYHVYLLFYLVLFQPLTRSLLLPVPLMRLVYLALGARLGENTYSAGVILDPPLTQVGSNSIIGHDAVLFSHAVEGDDLSLAAIRIGNNVTIGAKAVIMPGVTIQDGAIVAVSSVVTKGTHIGHGELWAGIPARRMTP
jgi:acetyltransferase-like isoleucine patch superfamily enzyme